MGRRNTNTKPRPFSLDDIHVRVVRGPHRDHADRWYWQARQTLAGERHVVWTGWGTLDQVKVALAPLVAGQRPARADDSVERVRDLLEVWLAWQLDRAAISPARKLNSEKECRHLAQHLGDVYLHRLNRDIIHDGLQEPALAAGLATGTVRNCISTLLQAWRWAQSPTRDLVPPTRLERPTLRQRAKRSRHLPTQADFWAALEQIPVERDWVRIVMLVIGSTGCRVQGIATATWGDLHEERQTITLTEKGHDSREAMIPEATIAELLAFKPAGARPAHPIIDRALNTIRTDTRKIWRQACEDAGVRYAPPSKVRTMVENLLFDAGADPGVVSAQLGHTPEVSLRHYRAASAARVSGVMAAAGLGPRPKVIDLEERRRSKEAGS